MMYHAHPTFRMSSLPVFATRSPILGISPVSLHAARLPFLCCLVTLDPAPPLSHISALFPFPFPVSFHPLTKGETERSLSN